MVCFDLELIRWFIQHSEMEKLDQNYVFYYIFFFKNYFISKTI